jgi:aryl-phospho-beta-D-glucosidase BglC (GH1 family)
VVRNQCFSPVFSTEEVKNPPRIALYNGINIGGYLSQCEHTKEHYESFITGKDIKRIASWGFDHVRVPVDYVLLEDVDGNEKKEGFEILERLTVWCEKNNLNMVIDLHKTYGYDFNDAGIKGSNSLFLIEKLQKRFIALWEKNS